MRIFLLLASCAVVASADVVVTNVTVLSAERKEPLVGAHVVVKGDRIAAVGTGAPPDGLEKIDGGGAYLVPGLIDSHVHLMSIPGMNLGQVKKHKAIVEAYEKQLPRSFLYYGYTTVIDLAVLDKKAIERVRNAPLGPDVFDCGAPLAFANGYPMHYVEEPDRFELFSNFIYDDKRKGKIPKQFRAKDHSPAAAVKRVKDSGGICVKAHYEPGFDGVALPTPPLKTLQAISRESRKAGLPLLIHANSYPAQKFALDAPPTIFAHGMWSWGPLDRKPELPEEIRATLDKIVAAGVGYQPTFQVMVGLRTLYDPAFIDSPGARRVAPASMLAWFKSPEGGWLRDNIEKSFKLTPKQVADHHDMEISQLVRTVNYLAEKKARFLFGTDTPSAPVFGNLPGLNGYLEMQQWVNAKIPLAEVFRAATLANAEAFGLAKDYGTVQVGKRANLLLLEKNPLETVKAYDTIRSVVLRGRVVPRETLAVE